jgi:hypothetical protein
MKSRKFGFLVARSTLGVAFVGACAFIGCSEPSETPGPGSGGSSTAGTTAGTGTGKAGTGGSGPGVGGSTAGTTASGGKGGSGTASGGQSGAAGSTAGTTGGSTAGTGTAGQGGSGATSGSGGSGASGGSSSGAGGAGANGQGGSETAGTGGSTAGTGGGGSGIGERPCDIYADAEVPCVAAYSTVRTLLSTYTGPLYQLRKGGPDPNTGSGGTTMDIGLTANGFADVTAHEAFCSGNEPCTFSVLYDQSGRGNDLTVGKAGCYEGTAAEDDYESDAKRRPLTVGGNEVYAL